MTESTTHSADRSGEPGADPAKEPQAPAELPEPASLKIADAVHEHGPVASAQAPVEAAEPVAPAPEPDPRCPSCDAPGAPGARFCEECGASMSGEVAAAPAPAAASTPVVPATRPCARCGGTVAADGYCEACGAPAMSERDHFEISAGAAVGGVCDRGIVHTRNEDAMALDVVADVTMIVVCDGVSTAPRSDEASLAATAAALEALAEGAPGGVHEVRAEGAARTSAWGELHAAAAERANQAVLAVPVQEEGDAPSCTYVAAVVDGSRVVVANVGDSRAYWLPDSGRAVRLTIDDSWAQEMMDLGAPASQVEGSPHAHAITRWLGPDAPVLKPRQDTHTVTAPGWLLLCSDGLWNYCADADELAALVRATAAEAGEGATATDLAGRLVAFANARGGRDNITAALARLGD